MRRAALAALLAALAALPAVAQPPAEPPASLEVVRQPSYAAGDSWNYNFTAFSPDRVNSTSLDQTVQVEALDAWNGVPTYRLRTDAEQTVPARPDDPTQVATHDTSTQRTWTTRDGLKVVRTERVAVRNQSGAFFGFLTTQEENWTFDPPRDDYQFPILGPGAGHDADAWLVLANATVDRNITYETHTANQTNVSAPQHSNSTVNQLSRSSWLRTQRLTTPAGTFDTVVIQTLSGNQTLFDYWAPAVGNLARRDILNATGRLVQSTVLVHTTFRPSTAPPVAPPPPPTGPGPATGGLPSWAPYAGAAGVGVLAALLVGAAWRRRAQAPQRGPGGAAGGAPPGADAGDPDAAPGAPGPAPGDEREPRAP